LRELVAAGSGLAIEGPDCCDDLIHGIPVLPSRAEIALNQKWTGAFGRLDLNLSRSSGNPKKPESVIVCSWVRNLQLRNLNPGHRKPQARDDLVDVTRPSHG